MGEYLRSSDPDMDFHVIKAAKHLLDLEEQDVTAVYEHDQWWLLEKATGRTWSVVDVISTNPLHAYWTPDWEGDSGISFELISEGEEE